jgi:hypothetical protein
MHRCALVSVNGGWNLLIGAQTTSGAWQEPEVPDACRTVWDEAEKDLCFERAAREAIASRPAAWALLAARKLGATFDYFGGAPWYLRASNPSEFSERDKVALGALETAVSPALLVAALLALARIPGPRPRLRMALAALGALSALLVHAWIGYLAFPALALLLGPRALVRAPPLVAFSSAVVFATALTHVVFFGAGRYGLVVAPFVAAVGLLGRAKPRPSLASESFTSSVSSGSSSRASTPLSSPVASGEATRASALYW